jgi:hypothetical protein
MGLNIDDVLRANDEMTEAIQRVRDVLVNEVYRDEAEVEVVAVEDVLEALDGEMTTGERLSRLVYDAARDGFYDVDVSVEDVLKAVDDVRNCEHDWITYGTRGQECNKCGFTHDYS